MQNNGYGTTRSYVTKLRQVRRLYASLSCNNMYKRVYLGLLKFRKRIQIFCWIKVGARLAPFTCTELKIVKYRIYIH